MICGKFPFDGSAAQVVHQVLKNEPLRPKQVNPKIPTDLQTIVLKCLEKEPTRRYQSAELLQQDLERFLEGKPIQAKPASWLNRSIKWARRNPTIAMSVAGLIVLAVFLAGAATQINVVMKQRDRAQNAEIETEKLLAQTTADAGILAMQRGQVERAVGDFRKAIELGHPEKNQLRFQLVKALYIQRNLSEAKQTLNLIRQENDSSLSPAVQLWELDLLADDRNGREPDSLRSFLDGNLKPADRLYAEALIAYSTPNAITGLKQSLVLDAFHFRSRRMLIFLHLASAQFEEAKGQLEVATQLFPESEDIQLFAAICAAGQGNMEEAETLLNRLELDTKNKSNWIDFAHFVYELRNKNDFNNEWSSRTSADLPMRSNFLFDVFIR